jgi:hypothetical protein
MIFSPIFTRYFSFIIILAIRLICSSLFYLDKQINICYEKHMIA